MDNFDDVLQGVLWNVHPEREIVIYTRDREIEIYSGLYMNLPYYLVYDILDELAAYRYRDDGVEEIVVDVDGDEYA